MIYLDHAATSPTLPEVIEAMLPWLRVPANASSAHRAGQAAAAALERARAEVAALVGADPQGVVFTSGATEANDLSLRGALRLRPGRVVASRIEHPSVTATVERLAGEGAPVTWLDVGGDGVIRLPATLPADTAVLAVMAANHETGVVQPVEAARALADGVGARLHVDATHAAGRIALPPIADGLALSAHKIGGPPGVGALILRDGGAFPAQLVGVQERGRRGGTVNVAGAVGFGVAARLASARLAARSARAADLSSRLEAGLVALGGGVVGASAPRAPGTTCVVFPGVRGDVVVQALDLRGICVSSGAACASGSTGPSPVLRALGHPEPAGGVRLTLGPDTDAAAIDAVLAALPPVLAAIRAAESP